MSALILLVLMACLAAGANLGFYIAAIAAPSHGSTPLAVGALLGATAGVVIFCKPVMRFVVRLLENRQHRAAKILSIAVVVLLLFLLAAFNLKALK